MSLDPDLQRLLQSVPIDFPTPVDWVAFRQLGKSMQSLIAGPGGVTPVMSVEERQIAGATGEVSLRIYRPYDPPTMTVIHLHGGGWTAGDLDTVDQTVRNICIRLTAMVVSCTYRLAPEDPFPAAFDDALAAAKWVLAHVDELGGDPNQVVIAGDSAGGNLAAAVAIALRNEARFSLYPVAQQLPALRAQLLLYPVVDLRDSAREAASYVADQDPGLRSRMLNEFISAYVEGDVHADWRISPLAADDLSDLPPALLVVLSVDPLRDQGVEYALRLRQAAVPCELIEFPHLSHGFVQLGAIVPAAKVAFDEVLTRFRILVNAGNSANDAQSEAKPHE